jgi:hypothetical protein
LKTAKPLDPAKTSRFEILGLRCILFATKSTEALDNAEVELHTLSVAFEKCLLSLTRFVSIQGI